MIADAFHHGSHAAVAHAEALAGHAADVGFAGGRAVKGDIADDDVFLRRKAASLRRADGQLGARESFAEIVVGIAANDERSARCAKGAETLSGTAVGADNDRVLRQAFLAVSPGDFVAEHGADRAVDVSNPTCPVPHALPFSSAGRHFSIRRDPALCPDRGPVPGRDRCSAIDAGVSGR